MTTTFQTYAEALAAGDAPPAKPESPLDHPCLDKNGDDICDQCGAPCEEHPAAPAGAPGAPSAKSASGVEVPFVGIALVLEYETDDGRLIESTDFSWRSLPLPLMYQDTNPSMGGHEGAVLIGRIEDVVVQDRRVWMRGVIDPNASDRAEAIVETLRSQTARFVSVDLAGADVEYEIRTVDEEGWPVDVLARFSRAVMAGATVTPFPAIPDAVIWLAGEEPPAEASAELPAPPMRTETPEIVEGDGMPGLLLAAASGSTSLPLSDRSRAWDAAAADKRVRSWAGAGEKPNAKYASAFFSVDGDGTNYTDYHLPFADVINGTLTAIWSGVTAVAAAIQGSRGASIQGADAIKPKVATYYSKAAKQYNDDSIKVPWASASSATLTAGAGALPPMSWFEDPELDGPTPLTVTDEGHVFGHLALWGVCHVGHQGCVTAPTSRSNYSYFRTGATRVRCDCADPECEEIVEIPTGVLTLGTLHAGLALDGPHALAHYEDTGLGACDLAVGEDSFGIWINGATRSRLSHDQLVELRGASPSGDWRRIGGALELVAILAVNVPGFPVPRTASRIVASGLSQVQTALIAPVDPRLDALTAGGRTGRRMNAARTVTVDREAWSALNARVAALERIAFPLRSHAADAIAASIER